MTSREIYEVEVRHAGLKRVRHIRGTDKQTVEAKAKAQYAAWDQLWQRRQNLLTQHPEANKKEFSEQCNRELRLAWDQICNLLRHALEKPHEILWETLKDHRDFPTPSPSRPERLEVPREPRFTDRQYQPNLGVLDHLFSKRRFRKIEHASLLFKREHREWEVGKQEILSRDEENQRQYAIDVKRWAEEKRTFLQAQKMRNEALDKRRDAYLKRTTEGLLDYCRLVLSNSTYPKCFPRAFELAYEADSKSLTLEYQMPAWEDIPKVKELYYDQLRDDIQDVAIPEPTLRKLYESMLYQLTLRVLYELYEADVIGMVDAIAFHGWVKVTEGNGGEVEKIRIVSVLAGRRDFFGLNLSELEPKDALALLNGTVSLGVLSGSEC